MAVEPESKQLTAGVQANASTVILATHGSAYQDKTDSSMSSTALHAAIDRIWHAFAQHAAIKAQSEGITS